MNTSQDNYWRDQVERKAAQVAREADRRREEEEQRHRESLYEADSWDEAFSKNLARLRHELALCEADIAQLPMEEEDRAAYAKMIEDWRRDIEANELARQRMADYKAIADQAYRAAMTTALAQTAYELDCRYPKTDMGRWLRANDIHGLLYW